MVFLVVLLYFLIGIGITLLLFYFKPDWFDENSKKYDTIFNLFGKLSAVLIICLWPIIMIETDEVPEKGNCDKCSLCCKNYLSIQDKLLIDSMRVTPYLNLQDFYCPIIAYVDVDSYNKWKQENENTEEIKLLDIKEEK